MNGRRRKFLRIELSEVRQAKLEQWAKHLWGPHHPGLAHVATALLDVAIDERVRRISTGDAGPAFGEKS